MEVARQLQGSESNMTFEEMQKIAEEIAEVLRKAGYGDVKVATDDESFSPGMALPIMFEKDGDMFVLEFNVA